MAMLIEGDDDKRGTLIPFRNSVPIDSEAFEVEYRIVFSSALRTTRAGSPVLKKVADVKFVRRIDGTPTAPGQYLLQGPEEIHRLDLSLGEWTVESWPPE
jgi:hypothetical protein